MEEWWRLPRWSDEYEQGVDHYIENAFATKRQGYQIRCPCNFCQYRFWHYRDVVRDRIICNGFLPRSEETLNSGKEIQGERGAVEHSEPTNINDDLQELLHDTLREGPNEEAKKFLKVIEEGQEELYPDCKTFSRLSFIIRLFIYKCDHKLSNVAFNGLLKLLRELLPDAKLPSSFHEANKVLKLLGLDYIKIDACPNDCMLYWEDHANATSCDVCGAPRWKTKDKDKDKDAPNGKGHRIPEKVLRYFPIKKRLQRLYMCSETASLMTWHENGREKEGLLQHPADGKAWKDFNKLYPKFAEDPRNVRLGLATDGFNPFHSMSIAHSTWPVILINYNLPPWMATKSELLMLSLLIPGPLSPGNDIDIYLQPLVRDLEDLWEFGIETYDVVANRRFDMHAALMSTISDFPAYAMLSGWSTKGKLACPCCHYETKSQWLDHSRKQCYMDHRIFLELSHPWRFDRRNFNGKIEDRVAPTRLSGVEVEELLHDFPNEFGKKRKKRRKDEDDPNPWKKLPIFFKLPYWKHISHRHNLDVMHIEKNVFDNVIGTLLDIPGKTKDHVDARRDLKVLGVMPDLQLKESEDGQEEMPTSRFWMTIEERRLFCRTIKNSKLPQGYASNISRCVHVNERKITGYKSHDAHFMMHHLLPIAVKSTLSEDVATPLIRLCNFFKSIWKKTINPQDLKYLHSEIVETLCQLEGIFPPAFFDVMVHLPTHLSEEIELGGPVASRCMYAIERYLRELKGDVRNKCRPEGSMAEGFLAKESARLCARYLHKNNKQSHIIVEPHVSQSFLPKVGYPVKVRGKATKNKDSWFMIDQATWAQAHRYVLFNCDCEEVERYISEHKDVVSRNRKRKWDSARSHSRDFMVWFQETIGHKLQQGEIVPGHLIWLSKGPSYVAKKHTGYFVNGYRFHTMGRDANSVTQNSGVTLTALTSSFASTKDKNPIEGNVNYYGSLEEIIEISYHGHFSVVLFRCVWYHSELDGQFTLVNKNKIICAQEPFILASQAHQVFYVEDSTRNGLHYKMKGSKDKAVAEQRVLPDYERQRLEKLKQNAEIMQAKGHGSLATKILQDLSGRCSRGAQDDDMISDDDDRSEEELSSGSRSVTVRSKKSSTMANSVAPARGTEKQQTRQPMCNPSKKSGSMAEFLKKAEANQKQQEVVEKPLTRSQKDQQILEDACSLKNSGSGSMAEFLKKVEAKQKQHEDVDKPSAQLEKQLVAIEKPRNAGTKAEFMKKAEEMQQQQQAAVEKPSFQPQKKQKLKSFCTQGSLSTYRDLRRRQVQSMNVDVVEHLFENEVECEGPHTCVNVSEAKHEREPALEHQTNTALLEQHVIESQPINEPQMKQLRRRSVEGQQNLWEFMLVH